ncbi:hypothetical protein Tco_1174761 [Tanacetum coccineum]
MTNLKTPPQGKTRLEKAGHRSACGPAKTKTPGVETIDVATGLKFNMRAMVLWTINDFPARSSLSGWSGQGYRACPTCNEDTPSVRVLGKTAYVGHRRFLKKPHKWRRSLEFNGETENGDPPREFNRDAIMTQLARLPTRVKGKHPRFGGVKIKRNVLVELNWTKRSIFYELEYWSFLTLKHNLYVMHIEKNVLENILNTLLMNDKSKNTAKARQDLKRLGIRSGLWFGQNKNEKCSKPQAAYSFKPEDKKSCQFIKGVKQLDGFGSNFKHKVTDNDTNIIGMKSHDCHIMMQHLLLYRLQQYLPPDVAKSLIELCLFFKKICSQTLMVDDMLKAQSKVIDILCNLELIYPPAFFDIMIHLVIHLPLDSIFDEPIRPRWMYPFERYMKKLKLYVRNKAMPKGSIAEGYVVEEALTFSSYYFRDVTTKFNRPNRNVDCPPSTCQFQVFKSLCNLIGLRSVIRIDHQELKKVIWYVLHNSSEIDTYWAKFKSEFPNKDMKEEFPGWFGKGIIVVEDDHDVIHVDNSSDLALSTSLNDLEIAALHIDGQSIDVDTPPDIIDVVDEDDDIIDEEDPIPHDLADSDDEDLANLDIDDGVNVMSADVARGHGGDGGGDDRPPSHHIPTGCGGCLGNRGKGTRKPNLGGRRAGRQHTRQETRNLGLKAITDKSGPVSIRFEFGDRETLMPLGEHAAHWANYLGELVRELPLHYPSWRQVPAEQKAGVMARIGTQFDMRPHMESDRWPLIYAAIQQHLQKIYNGKKAALKERHWIPDSDGTYDLERIRLSRPSHISEVNWDAQIAFWNDPKNRARATQNKQNRAKSKVVCRQGSRSIAALRDMHMESSATREYPSLIHTFFLTHTVNGVFLNPEDKALYGLGSNTETCVPYIEDEIMAIIRGRKQRGHIPGVGRVLPGQGTTIPLPPPCTHSSDVVKLKKREKVLTRQVNIFMKLFRIDDKFSQMLTQLESQPEIGGGSGSGGRGDNEQGDDEDNDEDGEDEDDS